MIGKSENDRGIVLKLSEAVDYQYRWLALHGALLDLVSALSPGSELGVVTFDQESTRVKLDLTVITNTNR